MYVTVRGAPIQMYGPARCPSPQAEMLGPRAAVVQIDGRTDEQPRSSVKSSSCHPQEHRIASHGRITATCVARAANDDNLCTACDGADGEGRGDAGDSGLGHVADWRAPVRWTWAAQIDHWRN